MYRVSQRDDNNITKQFMYTMHVQDIPQIHEFHLKILMYPGLDGVDRAKKGQPGGGRGSQGRGRNLRAKFAPPP